MIAVLGCGPAGLLAAQGARATCGKDIVIFSIKKPSVMRGAMYVHREIPDITFEPNGRLKYVKVGTKEGYALKVYGDPNADCSWDRYEGDYEFWSMVGVYDVLWNHWEKQIHEYTIDYNFFADLFKGPAFDLVISSVPLQNLCPEPNLYTWRKERVYITDHSIVNPDTILYNGLADDPWYRSSTICGHRSTEYPISNAPDAIEHGFIVAKPLGTDFDPAVFGPRLLTVGRYGRWAKDELVHDAYYDTVAKIQEMNL